MTLATTASAKTISIQPTCSESSSAEATRVTKG
jgi:hypothetical protein